MTDNNPTDIQESDVLQVNLPKEIIDLYESAKDAILFYELHELQVAPEAATELRDCLDHLMMGIQKYDDQQKFQAELNGALEHLRRASIEPLEFAVENLLADVINRYKLTLLFRIFLIRQIPKSKYKSKLEEIKTELIKGRSCKNMDQWRDGIAHFKNAYKMVDDLDFIIPYKGLLYGRIFSLLVSLLFFCLGILMQKFIL